MQRSDAYYSTSYSRRIRWLPSSEVYRMETQNSIILKFNTAILPKVLKIEYLKVPVDVYIPNPLQCSSALNSDIMNVNVMPILVMRVTIWIVVPKPWNAWIVARIITPHTVHVKCSKGKKKYLQSNNEKTCHSQKHSKLLMHLEHLSLKIASQSLIVIKLSM